MNRDSLNPSCPYYLMDGPFGAKGVGEPATIATTPAITNAIYNAIEVRISDLPVTPVKILKALKEKRQNK